MIPTFESRSCLVWLGPLNSTSFRHYWDGVLSVPHLSKKSKLQNQGLATVILQGLMPITTEPGPEDTNEGAPSRVTLFVLCSLPPYTPDVLSSRRWR